MRLLCNADISTLPVGVQLLRYGPDQPTPLRYDYRTPFDAFVRSLPPELTPDVHLFWLPEVNELPPGVADCPCPSATYASDWNLNLAVLQASLPCFDLVLTDRLGAGIWGKLGHPRTRWWTGYANQAGKILEEKALLEEPNQSFPTPRYDLLFIGNMMPGAQPERARWISRLLEADLPWRVRVEAACYGAPARELMRTSRLLFNHSIRGEANIRVFEALYCGTPVVIEAENREVGELLEAGSEYLPYGVENFAEELWALLQNSQRYAALQLGAARRLPELDPAAWSSRLMAHLTELQAEWRAAGSREPAGWSLHRREGAQLLQRLLCPTHVSPEKEAAEQLRQWLQRCSDPADLGLFFTSQALALQLDPAGLAQLERIFAQLQGQARGAVWRHFNRALAHQRNRSAVEPEAWNALLSLLEHRPGPEAWLGHGGVQPTDHFWSPLQAALWNEQIPSLFESAPTPTALLSSWARCRLAELAYRKNAPREALTLAEASCAAHPTAAAFCLQGRCRLDLELPETLTSFREARRLEPFHPDASLFLMLLLERERSHAELAPLVRVWSRGLHLSQVMYRMDEARLEEQRAVIAKCRVSLGWPEAFQSWGGPDAG